MIHAGSPANYLPDLMKQLFDWMKKSKLHPLVRSCIFHYEFEFIHPFADGNGRIGRLWQSLILQKWKDFFAWMPIESLIYEKQEGYYKALNASNTAGESTIFVTFMLVVDALRDVVESQNKPHDVGTNVGLNVGDLKKCIAIVRTYLYNILKKDILRFKKGVISWQQNQLICMQE